MFQPKSYPEPLQRRIHALKYLQQEQGELECKLQEEIAALEKKYLELYAPFFDRRKAIVNGEEPKEEEVEAGAKIASAEESEHVEGEEKEFVNVEGNGVPDFWLTAMANHPQLAELISEKDAEALKHLVDVRLSYLDVPGFKLEFEFSENAFFTNKILTKTYYYQSKPGYGGDYLYERAEGTEISWKEGQDITVERKTKKQRHKATGEMRTVEQVVPAESFFNFFAPPIAPNEGEELEEEELEELEERIEADYEVGETFKDKIIPHAIDWYTGKALEYEDFDGDFEHEFIDDEDDDEDDEEQDEDDV
ncbi:uncharacterized protein VTP21DRAFT_10851 [Calcarisporiella thermophila]|uniref:uncharacterized protein n=1 Tax=Calcarisporiella thermophila TaxID=911321 RepID=UPI0037433760